MTNDRLSGVVAVIAIGVIGWLAVQQIQMGREIERLQGLVSHEVEHEESVGKFWKLHHWSKDQINAIRVSAGIEMVSWPDLD